MDQIAEKKKQSTVHVATSCTRGKTLNVPKTTKLSSTTPSFSLIASSLAPNHWCYTLTWRHSLGHRSSTTFQFRFLFLLELSQVGGSHCKGANYETNRKAISMTWPWHFTNYQSASLTRSWLGPVYISRFSRLSIGKIQKRPYEESAPAW